MHGTENTLRSSARNIARCASAMPNLANSCAGSSARNLTQTRYARVLLVLLAARLPYLTERTVVRVVMHKNLTQTRYARGFNTVRVLLHTISYGMVVSPPTQMLHSSPRAISKLRRRASVPNFELRVYHHNL